MIEMLMKLLNKIQSNGAVGKVGQITIIIIGYKHQLTFFFITSQKNPPKNVAVNPYIQRGISIVYRWDLVPVMIVIESGGNGRFREGGGKGGGDPRMGETEEGKSYE